MKRLTWGNNLESLAQVYSQSIGLQTSTELNLWGEIRSFWFLCVSEFVCPEEMSNCTNITQAICRHWQTQSTKHACIHVHWHTYTCRQYRHPSSLSLTRLHVVHVNRKKTLPTGEQQQLGKCRGYQVLQRDNNDILLCNSPLLGLMVMTNGI